MEVKGDEESSLAVYSTCATAFPNSFYEADFEADFGLWEHFHQQNADCHICISCPLDPQAGSKQNGIFKNRVPTMGASCRDTSHQVP